MMPQFADPSAGKPKPDMVSSGLSLFIMGLFKKTVLADGIAPVATLVFDAASHGTMPGVAEAWAAALAYTFELYFDFSGYTDMALGSARIFASCCRSIFDSPYQSASIIEFWPAARHMTLSRFLRDYLYIPLGGTGTHAAPPRQSAGDHAAGRALAWCRLDLRRLGAPARRLAGAEPSVARHSRAVRPGHLSPAARPPGCSAGR
ncbi:MAG: hypothetical protein WDN69_04105 [Aliidongia sp.]